MTAASRQARRLARAACVLTVLLLAALGVIVLLVALGPSYPGSSATASGLADVPLMLSFVLVGLLVVVKRPENLVGWTLWLAGAGLLLGGALEAYGELALLSRPGWGLPAGAAVAVLGVGSWTPLMAGVFGLFVVFPSGRPASPRMGRFAVLVLAAFALVWAGITTSPGRLDAPLDAHENPLALTRSHAYFIPLIPVIAFCLVSVVLAGALALRRFRRSRGLERLQFKWLAASAGFLLVALPFSALFNWSRIAGAIFSLALIALPVSVGIAVLRYRLYEIDRIVSRTLVYGSLTVILGAAYAALVLAGQALFNSLAGGSNLAIAVSTLVVAALFSPLRSRVQRFVDRRFYRRRYDAQRTLEAFGARLRREVDLATLTTELHGVVEETMQPAHVTLWLREDEAR